MIAEKQKPFLTDKYNQYFKNPVNNEIYFMPKDSTSAYDLDTGIPLSARWLCGAWQFKELETLLTKK